VEVKKGSCKSYKGNPKVPFSVAKLSKASVYSRSLARIAAGSNPIGGFDFCLLWLLCVVK
jgi:hypothetical protein